MLKSFTVKNYRCFQDFTIGDLGRVNLIAGKNNTGKTALLEAIRLHVRPGDWRLATDMNKARGFDDPAKAATDLWGWLFYERRAEGGLTLESRDDEGTTRLLTILVLDPTTAGECFPETEKALAPALGGPLGLVGASRLILKFIQNDEPEQVSIGAAGAVAGGASSAWVGARIPWSMPCVYLGSGTPATAQDVQLFGELELAKRQDEILPVLKDRLEPRLERLALVPLAGEPVIHGDIGLPRLVPVPFMGEGTRRVLSILLAIANARGGVVLIDEIENGLHWTVQKQVWQAVGDAARRNDVQVFATTHSWECIREADAAFSEDGSYDLRLHRLDRIDGAIEAVSYTKEMIEASLATGLEMR